MEWQRAYRKYSTRPAKIAIATPIVVNADGQVLTCDEAGDLDWEFPSALQLVGPSRPDFAHGFDEEASE